MNRIQTLKTYGQSIWLDFISRGLLVNGGLKRLIDQGVTGVTSNPSIFQKAICETREYESIIDSIINASPEIDVISLYEKIVVEDIQMAADQLIPVYESTGGNDGFVSLEVSPHLAYLTASTISEAQRLWALVDRPNLMIKVPATPEGIPAIEALISQGVNVNATLIFSISQYENVAYAYIRGLEANVNPDKVRSVASFFVSRIDTAIDKLLENTSNPEALEMRGKAAIACAKLIYKRFREIFYGTQFEKQRSRGAGVQRLVWGSTGTKNPNYSDVLYVEEIIGPDTINTLPMNTLEAFLDHGKIGHTIQRDIDSAEQIITSLTKFGIDLTAVTEQLQKEGVQAFVKSYDLLIDTLRGKCQIT